MCRCRKNVAKLMSICFLLVLVSSCSTFYFEQPMPVDRPNSNDFPTHLTGTWQSFPDTGVYMINFPDSGRASSGYAVAPLSGKRKKYQRSQLNSSDDSLSLIIEETYFAVIVSRLQKIVKGAWPKLNASREFVYPSEEVYEFEKLIVYDSMRQPVDTVDQFIFRNAKMYDVDQDGIMSTGRAYWPDRDTFIMKSIDTLFFDLGNNAMLRQLNDRFYVLNIRGGVAFERNNWWQIYIIEKKADNIFSTWECSRKTKELPSLIYLYQDHTFYFNATWTAADIIQMMSNGYFVETDEYHLKQ